MNSLLETTEENVIYSKFLLDINSSGQFIVINEARDNLVSDWLDFVEHFLSILVKKDSQSPDNMVAKFAKTYIPYSYNYFGATNGSLNILGMGQKYPVVRLTRTQDNTVAYVATTDYGEIISRLGEKSGTKKVGYYSIGAIADRFLLFQWSKGKLLYPLNPTTSVLSRNFDLDEYVQDSKLMVEFKEHLLSRGFEKATTVRLLYSQMLSLLVSTSIKDIDSIYEELLAKIESATKNKENGFNTREKNALYGCNELRRILISRGRVDITVPRDNASRKSSETTSCPIYGILAQIDVLKHQNLYELREKAVGFKIYLEADGLAKGTIKIIMSHVKTFMQYLTEEYEDIEINKNTIDDIFNPNNEKGLKAFAEKKQYSKSGMFVNNIARFLKFSELLTPYALKHIPKVPQTRKLTYRKAMSSSMLKHLRDILVHRPPETSTKWVRGKANIEWWPHHNVYPVFPLMLLFHLYIPLRGGQVRHLCRDNSFVFNDENTEITHFVVNTDKNVNRDYLQRIPNVWDDLKVFRDFLKWHKEYFPKIPKYKYNNDDNSPWQLISPLFTTPSNLRPMSNTSHAIYLKRVLCQYQIEANSELLAQGKEPTVSVIRLKTTANLNIKVPTTINELNLLTEVEVQNGLQSSYDIHSFRVTGATRYLEAGLGLNLVMLLTGHTTPDMLMRIYIQLTDEEKQEHLHSAIDKIYFDKNETLVDSCNSFVKNELPKHYNLDDEDSIRKAFEDNSLKSFYRKAPDFESTKMELGTDIATIHHPSTWFSMIHGICPGVQCPTGREKKCSVCPYLITGKIFIQGIVHQANLSLINFHRIAADIADEEASGKYENRGKHESLDLLIEEILGWWEIIQKIDSDIKHTKDDESAIDGAVQTTITPNSLVTAKPIYPEIAYLEANYDAFQMGVEKDRHGLALLAICAYNIAKNGDDEKIIQSIIKDDKKLIDWLMKKYTDSKENNLLPEFIKKLKGVDLNLLE